MMIMVIILIFTSTKHREKNSVIIANADLIRLTTDASKKENWAKKGICF